MNRQKSTRSIVGIALEQRLNILGLLLVGHSPPARHLRFLATHKEELTQGAIEQRAQVMFSQG